MNRLYLNLLIMFAFICPAIAQVDTSFIYNQSMPYGTLDIRVSKSASNYYYLDQNKTFSFRTENGVKTDSYLHMTAWDTEQFTEGQLREKFVSSSRFLMNYRLLFPANYRTDVDYPIVIFFHGLNEPGNCNVYKCIHANHDYDPNINVPAAPTDANSKLYNNDYHLLNGARRYLAARDLAGNKLVGDPTLDPKAFPGFVLFAQSNNEWSPFEVEHALRLLRLVIKKHNVDQDRVYVNGLSRGGYAAFEAIKRAPWMFAAGIMFSAVSDANITTQGLVPSVRHIPLWLFQGGKDLLPTPRATEDRLRIFQRDGMSVRYTKYAHLGHGTWNTGMSEPDFFSWLLGFSNTKIRSFGGGASICSTEPGDVLTLYLPAGYKEYQWQRNMQTVKTGPENFLVVSQVGSYRARFRYSDTNLWNDWSEEIVVDTSLPAQASFTQLSTLHLPDLNNINRTFLSANGDFEYYTWFKDDVLIDFPGSADDQISIATIDGTFGTGHYSLRVAGLDGCYSSPSEKQHIFFNGESPVDLTAPGEVNASGKSPSEVDITWSDNSDGESGFEVWRRLMDGASQWVMATITGPNIESFSDSGLKPSSKYEYKIRAVSATGRSDYFPGTGDSKEVETSADETPPTKPENMIAELGDINSIFVQWEPSTDNTFIQQYIVYVNGIPMPTTTADTTFWLRDLNVNTYFTIQVAAVDADGNIGPKSVAVSLTTEMTGLFYTHATGSWLGLDSIDWAAYEYSGHIGYFALSPKTQEDFFNFRFDGYIYIQNAGTYEFRITSNDGGRILLNKILYVKNDSIHETTSATGTPQAFENGPLRITVDFFDFMGEDFLLVEYKGPDTGGEWKTIDEDVLTSLGLPESGGLELIIYPNPGSNGITQLIFRGGNGDPLLVRVSDAMGKMVREYILDEVPVDHLTITDLPTQSGVYIITVNQSGTVVGERLIVIH